MIASVAVDRDPLDAPGRAGPAGRGRSSPISPAIAQAVRRQGLELVLARDEDGAGVGAGVAQEAVERGVAEAARARTRWRGRR